MKLGTIAQHSNIGPTSPDTIIPNNVPGRLNDYDIWAWWDFTDPIAAGGGTTHISGNLNFPCCTDGIQRYEQALQQMDDKGPNNASLSADSTLKGPHYYPPNGGLGYDNGRAVGQDKFGYLHAFSEATTYMQFNNPTNLYQNNFTIIMILDYETVNTDRHEYLFKLQSSGKDITCYRQKDGNTFFLTGNSMGVINVYGTFFGDTNAGDQNDNFNWIAFTVDSSGVPELYSRGKYISPTIQYGSFGSTYIAAGSTSVLFGKDDETDSATDSASPNVKIYEMMIYNERLTQQELYHIDNYIQNKYKSYEYGRIKGY